MTTENLLRDTSPQSPDVVRGHHGGSGASMYETQPHYMQALETIHRLTRGRDVLVETLQGMIGMARIEARRGSKAWAGAADVAEAALAKLGQP